jgi:signal transduction histidine kinase
MRSGRIATPARLAGVLTPLLVGAILAILLVVQQRDDARTQAESAVRGSVASTVTKVRTEIRNELAAAPTGPAAKVVPADRVASAPISTTIAITARDSGTATLDDTARPPSIVVPVFRGTTPTTTAARRAAIMSYRVVPLTLQPTLADLQPVGGGLIVRGPTHMVASAPKPAPPGALVYSVDMDLTGSPGWDVESWVPAPGTPAAAWLWAIGIIALFGAVAAVIARLQQRETAAAARLRTLERDRSLVTGLAPVMQASLDLGEVAPAVSSHLSDGLGLSGLSLATPGDKGEKQVFAWGTAPDPRVRPVVGATQRLAAGQTLAIQLTRGGRTLGVLRVVAGEPLGPDELVALGTASDLLGSTLANAETFTRQQELVERMRSVDELKTVFLATASHELRTPVTAIVGFSTLILERWEEMGRVQQRALIERVQANGHRLGTLIEQLLDFSQLERGLPRPSDEMLDLGDTVRRILGEQPELRAGHELVENLADDCHVRGSSAALERILTNLVGNAAKYSPGGTSITVTVRAEGDRAVLLVDDEGPGVPVEDRERVFSRFFRGRGDSVARTRGAGIGLAIVAEYAASMSGVVSVGQAPGGGARFSVSLPIVGPLVHASSGGESDVAIS